MYFHHFGAYFYHFTYSFQAIASLISENKEAAPVNHEQVQLTN